MDNDLAIVERFKAGETEVFSELVHKYKKPILNLIYRLTGRAEDAEDLAQEVFLRAFKGLPDFKAQAKFFTWLYKIAINVSLRVRKRNSRFIFQSLEQKVEEGCSEIQNALADQSGPEQKTERKELKYQVQKAILELDEDQRTIVILYRYQNLSYEEIGRVLNISLSAVKSRLHRARKNLARSLEPYVED